MNPRVDIICMDALTSLSSMADESVHCVVTSPPYYGLRDYKVEGQIGLEKTLDEYIVRVVAVFDHVWRVLRKDGTLWLNMGDAYANDGKWGGKTGGKQSYLDDSNRKRIGREKRVTGLKSKDLIGQPCILAGCPPDGVVLDPFGGSGTVGLAAARLGRNAILIDLNPDYARMAARRIKDDAPLITEVNLDIHEWKTA